MASFHIGVLSKKPPGLSCFSQGSWRGCLAISSVQSLSRVPLFVTPWTAAWQASCPLPTPRACSNSCPSRRWCYPIISSSVGPFSCLQSFPASGSFLMSPFLASEGQSIGASDSASVLPMNIQNWMKHKLESRLPGEISITWDTHSFPRPLSLLLWPIHAYPHLILFSFLVVFQSHQPLLSPNRTKFIPPLGSLY